MAYLISLRSILAREKVAPHVTLVDYKRSLIDTDAQLGPSDAPDNGPLASSSLLSMTTDTFHAQLLAVVQQAMQGNRRPRRDPSLIRCYNCQEMSHYARTCINLV